VRQLAGVVALLLTFSIRTNAQSVDDKVASLPSFLDEAIPRLMSERHVAGAVVAVVRGDQTIYLRAFGRAVVESDDAVDQQTTAFRIGSVSKLFTAIAALQLVDAGHLDLQRNIADYLGAFRLRFPTTMHQLLTHTAGLDERFTGAYTESTPLPTVTEHLRLNPPQQVRTPGQSYSYSNYHYAVAGGVIEAITKQRFESYLEDHVFAPLRMRSTTAFQPPGRTTATVARGYRWTGGHQDRLPQRFTFASPSGGITTSGLDMARLLRALLNDGVIDGARILSASSVRRLFDSQYSPDPHIPAATYGAIKWRTRGRELIFKDGTLGDQIGVVVIDPDNGLGIFLASNTLPGIGPLVDPMLTHLFGPPIALSAPPILPGAASRAKAFRGVYRNAHHTRHDMSRLRALMPMIQTRVSASSDGSLAWQGRRWIEVAPMLFRSADREDYIVFRADSAGAPAELLAWGSSYERIGIFEQTAFHVGVLLSSVAGFVSYIGLRLVRLRRARETIRRTRLARFSGVAAATVNLTFVAGLPILFGDLGAAVPLPLVVRVWLALPVISLVMAPILVGFAVLAWRGGWWTRGERIAYSASAVAAVAFLLFLNYWRLLVVTN
jgi:CubicO group peptidase (beta-lactamase class C family)